jgi:acetylornithine/N-succinyldiaminopimelate aminotransferase
MQYHAANTDSLMSITNRPDLVFERGEGSWLYDHRGKAYLDFIQGWAVNTLGHCPPEIAAALAAQAGKLINPSPAFYNGPMIELAGLLTANSVFDRVFFANTGAEANEGAIKLARKWGRLHKDGAYEIITFGHSFHGARWPPCRLPARPAGTRSTRRKCRVSRKRPTTTLPRSTRKSGQKR